MSNEHQHCWHAAELNALPQRRLFVAGHGAPAHQRDKGHHYTIQDMCRLQGLPEDFLDDAPFTAHGKRRVIGNGVPLPLGRAIAAAVRRAMGGKA